ncbi:MAG: pyridoxal-phosphate dependent enzyme [Actinobacteria bacterium]|nr:pyridoxal-phosphate dependent enzyme [Actinomycetota bacterium]
MGSAAVDLARIRAAAAAGAGVVRETPVLSSRNLSERVGGAVALKAESLQRTGSFKLRGALAKLAALGDAARGGVVAGSAGNHGRAVAYAAREHGVPCEIFMPEQAPVTKVEACRAAGAHVRLTPGGVDDAVAAARAHAADAGLAFVHPFDDADVVAGQGGVGLELAAQVPQLARVIVPLGGGGLASGVAIAVKQLRPDVRVVGVRIAPHPTTIADGIAVKHAGELTRPLLERWVDEVVTVAEDDVAEAMVLLMERSKLVVEGAGAVGVAALLSGVVAPAAEGTTAVVLSGGNVDVGLLASLARRHESIAGRRLVLTTTLPDRPGELGRLLGLIAAAGANLLDVVHLREGVALHVRESAVQLVLETRDRAHAQAVLERLREASYEVATAR